MFVEICIDISWKIYISFLRPIQEENPWKFGDKFVEFANKFLQKDNCQDNLRSFLIVITYTENLWETLYIFFADMFTGIYLNHYTLWFVLYPIYLLGGRVFISAISYDDERTFSTKAWPYALETAFFS